jgi:hypothetical protein
MPKLSAVVCLAFALTTAACTNSAPTQPSTTGSAAIAADLTASIVAPRPSTPANNSQIKNADQPVVLIVQNAISTRPGVTYTFEVATDSGFASKVQTKDGVAEGSGGLTGVKLDALTPARDYYWHARATSGGTTGLFSAPFKFTVGPAITINAPSPIGPLSNTTTTPRPALRVTNATRSGAGVITYRFEVADSAAFTTIVASATVPEGINETGFIPATDLPIGSTLFWRATAIDAANGVSSAPSAAQSFTTKQFSQAELVALQLGVPLWPGAVPPGTIGHATMGAGGAFGVGWNVQTLYYAPQNVTFQSPDVEMLRFFDLFDRGFDPDAAIGWMNTNGYPTAAVWYPPPDKAVLGLHYVYLASRNKVFTNGTWDIVLRVE